MSLTAFSNKLEANEQSVTYGSLIMRMLTVCSSSIWYSCGHDLRNHDPQDTHRNLMRFVISIDRRGVWQKSSEFFTIHLQTLGCSKNIVHT